MSNGYNANNEEMARQHVGELKNLAAREIHNVFRDELDDAQIERLSDVDAVSQSAREGTFS
jgi:hypothetical protein